MKAMVVGAVNPAATWLIARVASLNTGTPTAEAATINSNFFHIRASWNPNRHVSICTKTSAALDTARSIFLRLRNCVIRSRETLVTIHHA